MPVTVPITFTDAQVAFIRSAADTVAPGLTNQQLVEWVQGQAVSLVADRVKTLLTSQLLEQHNSQVRQWEQGYRDAFPQELAE